MIIHVSAHDHNRVYLLLSMRFYLNEEVLKIVFFGTLMGLSYPLLMLKVIWVVVQMFKDMDQSASYFQFNFVSYPKPNYMNTNCFLILLFHSLICMILSNSFRSDKDQQDLESKSILSFQLSSLIYRLWTMDTLSSRVIRILIETTQFCLIDPVSN